MHTFNEIFTYNYTTYIQVLTYITECINTHSKVILTTHTHTQTH